MNKWECVFLPTSNCSVPRQLTDCHDINCRPKASAVLFTNASEIGVAIPKEELKEFQKYLKENFQSVPGLHSTGVCLLRRGYHSNKALTLIDNASTVEHQPGCNQDVIGSVFTRGFIFRFNAAFRSIVNHKVNHITVLNSFDACHCRHYLGY